MFADEIRRAVMAASRDRLAALSAALWKAFAAQAVTEAEAEEISGLIESRKAVPAQRPKRVPAATRPPRPRDPARVERRRRWQASGWLPPKVAARFTPAEAAALAVVAWRISVEGRCALPIDRVASLAGVSRTKVKDAIRLARHLGLLSVEERRRSRFRSDTNVVRVACGTWRSWLDGVRGRRLARGQGGGVGKATAFSTGDISGGVRPAGSRPRLPGRRVGRGPAPGPARAADPGRRAYG